MLTSQLNASDHLQRQAALLQGYANSDLDALMARATTMLVAACQERRPILVCGNGGSAADAMHIVGELVGRFLVERPAIRAIALSDNPSVITAWSNDYDFDTVFSRQVEAHAEAGGVLWGLSTSGNSRNVVEALRAARAVNMHTLCMTGAGGGLCAQHSDILLDVPSTSTPEIQQVHICLYHYLCAQMEASVSEPGAG